MDDGRLRGADDYFDAKYAKWDATWQRFGIAPPNLGGADVLDFGCGYGASSVRAAQAGARVVGLDIDEESIVGARDIAARRFADLGVTYVTTPIEDLTAEFDVILTNEVLEHVVDLPGFLNALKGRLRPGGVIYAGWGPLWFSPTGGHQLTAHVGKFPVPWSHLVKPIARAQRDKHTWTFNYLRPSDYESIIRESGFDIVSWRVNPGSHPAYRALRFAAKFLPTPFTANIYAVLRNP